MATGLAWTALLLVTAGVAVSAASPAEFPFKKGERVVFLGDSITFAGRYVQYVDAYVQTRFPERKVEVLNLGLPSETCTGLSEPDHPWPRPNVHERLDRVLARTRPDVVVACYGMNDGIYYPFSKERFAAYQAGIQRLVEKSHAAGARVVLVTPSMFDAEPVKKSVLPITAPKFSWVNPYAGYDEVLTQYSRWLLTLRAPGLPVVDAHSAVKGFVEAARAKDPKVALAGDGVHPNPTGEWLIAQAVLEGLGAPAEVDTADVDARNYRGSGVSEVRRKDYGLDLRWTPHVPLPYDPAWDGRMPEQMQIGGRLNRFRLVVRNLQGRRYSLFEELKKVGEVTAQELEGGVDLTRFPELSCNRRAAEVLPLIRERERLLGLAWLTHCGYKRPDTPQGLPLDEAQRKAEPLTRRIQELCRPVPVTLKLSKEE